MLYRLVSSALFLLPAETAHHVTFGALRATSKVPGVLPLLRALLARHPEEATTRALGLELPSPLGLAAGFDKDAKGFEVMGALGFGYVEVGTLTAQAQPGNPKPRLFRLKRDGALINRLGFNNGGARMAAARLEGKRKTLVGVNIGKTKIVPEEDAVADYVYSTRQLAPCADYFVVNVSSPNTPGLRNLQATEKLRPLLTAVREALDEETPGRRVPLLVKIAPDLADEDVLAVADLALELGLDGIVATNTTIGRGGLSTSESEVEALGAGGLSGPPVKTRALQVLRLLRGRVGDELTLVAVGGISDADDAWERIKAGATLLQLYTGFIYGGPFLPRNIARGLAKRARAEGYGSVQDAVGVDAPLVKPNGARRASQ